MVLYRLYSPPTAVGDVRGGAARSLRNYLNAHSPKSEEDSWAHRKFMMYRRLRPTCGVPAVAQGPLPQGRSSRVCYPHLSVSRPSLSPVFLYSFIYVYLFYSQPNPILFFPGFRARPVIITHVHTCMYRRAHLYRIRMAQVQPVYVGRRLPHKNCAEFIHES